MGSSLDLPPLPSYNLHLSIPPASSVSDDTTHLPRPLSSHIGMHWQNASAWGGGSWKSKTERGRGGGNESDIEKRVWGGGGGRS